MNGDPAGVSGFSWLRAQSGFTLIELMIVVAIIGILAAIALPQYQDYVTRSRWSDNISAIGQIKTAIGECLQNQGGANSPPSGANCSDISNGGSLEVNGVLPSDWAGPAVPTFATAVPTTALVGTNGVSISITGTQHAGGCIVRLSGTAFANQLTWDFDNTSAGNPAGCGRSKTGVGT